MRVLLVLPLVVLLSACTTLSPRGDDAAVGELVQARSGVAVTWSQLAAPEAERRAIDAFLQQPLTLNNALRVALLRSPRLQAEYARLGIARSEVQEALQIENPKLEFSRLSLSPHGGHERGIGLTLPLADLLTLPLRARLAAAEHERLRFEMAAVVLEVLAEVEAAWFEQLAAQQVAQMREVVAEGADAAAELAQRLYAAGNISELQLKQEQAAASTARIEAARARAESLSARLAFNTLLGLSGSEAQWRSGDRLPLPVAQEDDPEALLLLAREHNLSLLAARHRLDIAADALGLRRGLRWLGGAELGFERERESSGERKRGPSLEFALPIFHQQQAGLAKARGELDAARAHLVETELAIEHGIRLGSQRVQELAKIVATYRRALVPQREVIVQRSQQEYNFMLIGAFELIRAKLEEYDAYQGYLEAVRDYWLARVELMRAVGRSLPSDASIRERTPDLQQILSPPDGGGHDPHGHGGHR